MKNKYFFIISVGTLVVIVGVGSWFFIDRGSRLDKLNKENKNYISTISEISKERETLKKDIEAKDLEIKKLGGSASDGSVSIPQDVILYFYSDTCSHCIAQKPIVLELEKEGIKFQWMNIADNKQYLTDYRVEGTPTFIFKKLDNKLLGQQTKEQLKSFWENN